MILSLTGASLAPVLPSKEKARIGQVMPRCRHCWRIAGWPGSRFAVPAGLIGALLLLAVALAGPVRAQTPATFETAARFMVLMDSRTGKVFAEKDADELMGPASMSKVMTMLMVFERLRSGRLKLDDEFLVSEDAWRRGGAASGGSTMYAELNSRVKLSDLIKGVIVQSANDACIAIAEGIAGSEAAFADMMTQRVRELGLTKTVFKNATGLPEDGHVTTARELGMLARYLIEVFPEYFSLYSEREFTWNNITQKNRNPLLGTYPGADGLKTGYTSQSGYGLIGTAKRGGRRLILVVNGIKSAALRSSEAQKLLDWGFRQFRSIELFAAGQTVGTARVWGGTQSFVALAARENVDFMLSDDERAGVEAEIVYTGPLRAPVAIGVQVGVLRFKLDGRIVSQVPLYTAENVAAGDQIWRKALDSVLYYAFGG